MINNANKPKRKTSFEETTSIVLYSNCDSMNLNYQKKRHKLGICCCFFSCNLFLSKNIGIGSVSCCNLYTSICPYGIFLNNFLGFINIKTIKKIVSIDERLSLHDLTPKKIKSSDKTFRCFLRHVTRDVCQSLIDFP